MVPGMIRLSRILMLGLLSAAMVLAGCSPYAIQPRTEFEISKDVLYSSGSGYKLLADIYTPASDSRKRPAILILHGGSWQRGNKERMSDVAQNLAGQGFVVMNANYRLAPDHPYPAQIEDVRKAVSFLRKNANRLHLDAEKIGVLGYSAGGHIALLLALLPGHEDSRVQAVVTAGAPTDLTAYGDIVTMHRLLQAEYSKEPKKYEQASPYFVANGQSPPALLIHGTYDWIVPVSHARKMFRALREKGAPVELEELPDGHMATTLGVHEESLRLTVDFFRRNLESPTFQ